MKIRLTTLKLLITFFTAFATTAIFGQAPLTFVWTNQTPPNAQGIGDLNITTNWNPNGAPTPMTPTPDVDGGYGDVLIFNGQTTGPLKVTQSGGTLSGFGGQAYPGGVRFLFTANQTSPVTIYTSLAGTEASPVASGGIRINWFAVDAGAGGLNVGINSTTNIYDIVSGIVNGQILGFTNNSSTPCVINPDVRWRMGGAGAHPHVFTGTGDWIVNNHMRSANSSSIQVQKFGPGTMTWIGTNVGAQATHWFDPLGPITIGEGTMIWKTSDLVSAPGAGNPNIVHNGTLWKYDVQPTPGLVTGPGQVLGNVSGAGPFQMAAGDLTFGGANTFSGNITLTGGRLIAGSTENVGVSGPLGQGGIISFNGGTLGWSLANAFDYSSRFDASANQAYNLDTGGASPTLATGLSSSGGSLTKLGGGTLTLAGASTYTGPTTVGAGGGLLFQGTKSGNADITVADTATLGVFQNGFQITPNTLTLGTSTGATLEFNNVTNHTTATLAPNNLVSSGTVTINVNSGRFLLIGETFPLLKWTSGPAPAVTLGFLAGAGGHLTTNGNQIDLVIDNPPYIWTGANSLIWDTATVNWVRNASPVAWVNGNYALLDDSAGANTNLTLSGSISPTNATIANSGSAYAITNSPGNVISGPGSLTKSGNGTLILPGGANNYTGVTTLGGGVLGVDVLANGGSVSDIGAASSASGNIVFNGGTLQYTGPGVSMDRLFSVGPGGGTIDNEGAGVLAFTNTGSLGMTGNGPRALTLTGPGMAGDTIASAIVNHPAGTSLRKTGLGLWILTGTNTYAGGTSLLEGNLQVGTGGGSGTLGNGNISTAAGTAIDFQRAGAVTVPGAINGSASVTINGSGTVILANNNGYSGGTTINTGTLQVGNGGGSGSLFGSGAIVNNSLLDFNTAGSFAYGAGANGIISGSGNVIFRGGGTIKAIGNNSYTGWTRIDANTTFFCREGQDGTLLTSAITNNGTLRMVEQNTGNGFAYAGPIVGSGRVQVGANNVNVGQVVLTGTNTYTGGTFIGGNELILGDNGNAGFGTIAGNVQFVNNFTTSQDNPRTITLNRPAGDDFTFSGTITTNFASPQANLGIVQLNGGATVTLTANNTYGGGTVLNNGTLVVGNGGGSGTLGFGPVTLNSVLIFNRSGNLAVGTVTGTGSLTKRGTGTVTLRGSSTAGSVVLEAGTLGAAPVGAIGSLDVAGDLTIVSGSTLLVGLDRSLSPSNSVFNAASITHTNGGILRLINGGPGLVVGDKFSIFNQLVPGGASMTIVSPGFSVQNDLAVDGSVTVTGVLPPPTITTAVVNGTNLNLSWPSAWTGGVLVQGQTNSLAVGISNNWVTIPGTDAGNTYSTVIRQTNQTVFFRLINP